MAKRRRRRRNRTGQGRQDKSHVDQGPASIPVLATNSTGELCACNYEEQHDILVLTLRAIGVLPIVLLVAILAIDSFIAGIAPNWLLPVIDEKVAVLTLSAGHAAIIGLMMRNRGRITLSAYPLLVAGIATALAGFHSIGDSTVGAAVALSLDLMTALAIWAVGISTWMRRIWPNLRSIRTLLTFVLFAIAYFAISTAVRMIVAFQSQDENYWRNWLLIPFLVLVAFVFALAVVWRLMRLAYRNRRHYYDWLSRQLK